MALVGGQLAAKHKFHYERSPWTVSSTQGALQIFYAPGPQPHLDDEIQQVRLEARCYGESQDAAAAVWRQLVNVSRETLRTVVTTGDGQALIYLFNQDSGPEFAMDAELQIDVVRQYFRADVSELEPV